MTDTTPPTEPLHVTHDWESGEAISLTIIEAVESLNDEADRGQRLYDHINPDALEALLRPLYDGTPREDVVVTFEFGGYTIRADGSGAVRIHATGDEPAR